MLPLFFREPVFGLGDRILDFVELSRRLVVESFSALRSVWLESSLLVRAAWLNSGRSHFDANKTEK